MPNLNAISADGRYVAFNTESVNVVSDIIYTKNYSGAPNNVDTYIFDRLSEQNKLVSRSAVTPGQTPNGTTVGVAMSADGRVLLLASNADDIIANDYDGSIDLFLYTYPAPIAKFLQPGDGTPQRSLVKQLTVTFDQPVAFAGNPAAAFTLTRQGGGSVSLSAAVSNINQTVTLTFGGPLTENGSLADGDYTLTIDATQVSGPGGALDGDGNGTPGGNYVSKAGAIFRLFGDVDGNRRVDGRDFNQFLKALYAPPVSANLAFDYDANGTVDTDDIGWLLERLFVSLDP